MKRFSRRLSLLVCVLASFVTSPLIAQEVSDGADRRGPTDRAEFEAFTDGVMHELLAQFHAVGAVVTVVSGGDLFFAKGYGYSDWQLQDLVDPETTLFRIGSVSKLFVWTSVMQMVEQGLLDLDVDINEYLDLEIPATFDKPITSWATLLASRTRIRIRATNSVA